jgi:hypothetical protein
MFIGIIPTFNLTNAVSSLKASSSTCLLPSIRCDPCIHNGIRARQSQPSRPDVNINTTNDAVRLPTKHRSAAIWTATFGLSVFPTLSLVVHDAANKVTNPSRRPAILTRSASRIAKTGKPLPRHQQLVVHATQEDAGGSGMVDCES